MAVIGIAGGGQLGRMLTEAAHALGHTVVILDPTENSPAGQVADEQIIGDFKEESMMLALAAKCDVVTYEIEAVNTEALVKIAQSGKPVHPTPKTLGIIRDKLQQKIFFMEHGINTAQFVEVSNEREGVRAGEILGYPFIVKARTGGFDGRGNAIVQNESDIWSAMSLLGPKLYGERLIKFDKELAVIAARTVKGEVAIYALTETVHQDHICQLTMTPADVTIGAAEKAYVLARQALRALEGAGVFGIEMFLTGNEVLVNEISPRVHNSGHWTIEGCETSQFEQHIRTITGMPLGPINTKAQAAVTINILGNRDAPAEPKGIEDAEKVQNVKVHIYGKAQTRVKRKMGHLTALGESLEAAKASAQIARAYISI